MLITPTQLILILLIIDRSASSFFFSFSRRRVYLQEVCIFGGRRTYIHTYKQTNMQIYMYTCRRRGANSHHSGDCILRCVHECMDAGIHAHTHKHMFTNNVFYGWMDGWMDGRKDGWMDGCMDATTCMDDLNCYTVYAVSGTGAETEAGAEADSVARVRTSQTW